MSQTSTSANGTASAADKITPELVREVADKVYALWLAEQRQLHERRRLPHGRRQQAKRWS